MMTQPQIVEYCKETFRNAGYDFNKSNIQVSLNGRMTTTLGKCISVMRNGKYTPVRIEISKALAEDGVAEDIIEVIRHECAHALVSIETGERHGHDSYFKNMCYRIGTTNDKTNMKLSAPITKEKGFKYIIYCPNCGQIGGYYRMCTTLKNLDQCHCKKCGIDGPKLLYVQNY